MLKLLRVRCALGGHPKDKVRLVRRLPFSTLDKNVVVELCVCDACGEYVWRHHK